MYRIPDLPPDYIPEYPWLHEATRALRTRRGLHPDYTRAENLGPASTVPLNHREVNSEELVAFALAAAELAEESRKLPENTTSFLREIDATIEALCRLKINVVSGVAAREVNDRLRFERLLSEIQIDHEDLL